MRVGAQALQTELEDLEQADRPRADDHGIGVQGSAGVARRRVLRHAAAECRRPQQYQRMMSLTLPGWPFHSSASGRAALRLVMGFQPGRWSGRR